MGKGGLKIQISSCKVSHRDVMFSMVTPVLNTILYVLKLLRVNLKSPHHRENNSVTTYGDMC